MKIGVDSTPVTMTDGRPTYGPVANDGRVAWSMEQTVSPYDCQVFVWQGGVVTRVADSPDDCGESSLALGNDVVVYNIRGLQGLFYKYPAPGGSVRAVTVMDNTNDDTARMDGNLIAWLANGIVYYTYLNQADIAVAPADIVPAISDPVERQPFDVSVTVHNLTTIATSDTIAVTLYDGDPDAGGVQLGAGKTIAGLQGLAAVTVSFPGVVATTEGEHDVYAGILPSGPG